MGDNTGEGEKTAGTSRQQDFATILMALLLFKGLTYLAGVLWSPLLLVVGTLFVILGIASGLTAVEGQSRTLRFGTCLALFIVGIAAVSDGLSDPGSETAPGAPQIAASEMPRETGQSEIETATTESEASPEAVSARAPESGDSDPMPMSNVSVDDASASTGPVVQAYRAEADIRAPEPVHMIAREWETHCEPGCRTFTTADFDTYPDAPATKMVLEIDPTGRLLVSALDTAEYNSKYYRNGPTELRRDGVDYVPASHFFNPRDKATLSVDGASPVELTQIDDSHLRLPLSETLLASLRTGHRARLVFFPLTAGKARGESNFSLMGFTAAYAARTVETKSTTVPSPDARSIIARHLPGNQFRLERDDLREWPNPHGKGVFVFVPELPIGGITRTFVWFINGGEAVALNGPSKTATPAIRWPREASFRIWDGTGLTAANATERGLAIARQ